MSLEILGFLKFTTFVFEEVEDDSYAWISGVPMAGEAENSCH
jgi:hypothetical protein